MKLGDKVWVFDSNIREYVDDEGKRHASPIYRKKFIECYIIGETRVSWIISHYTLEEAPEWAVKKGTKVKKADEGKKFWSSEEDVEKECWIFGNAYRISEKVRKCDDYDILKRIDEMIE